MGWAARKVQLARVACRKRLPASERPKVGRLPFWPPASGCVLFLLAQKKNQKKGAPTPYRSVGNAFALWASTALNTGRCVYPASQAVDPIRRSRSSNGNGVSHGLRAAEGNSGTSRSYEKYYTISSKGGHRRRAEGAHGLAASEAPKSRQPAWEVTHFAGRLPQQTLAV